VADPCLDSSDPCVSLTTVAGALKASVRRHPGASPGRALTAADPNGLACTPDGLWAPPDRFSWTGSAQNYTESVDLGDPTYGEFVWPGSPTTLSVVNSNASRPMCLMAIAFAEGRTNLVSGAVYEIFLRTRMVVDGVQVMPEGVPDGTFATPSRYKMHHTGTGAVEGYWTTQDVVVFSDVPPGSTAQYEIHHAYSKPTGPGGGYLEGFMERIQFFAGHQL
jgi:hypothetical protein